MTDDELKAIEGKVQAVNKPCSHHSTMQDAVIFRLLQSSVPALIAELRAAREALAVLRAMGEWIENAKKNMAEETPVKTLPKLDDVIPLVLEVQRLRKLIADAPTAYAFQLRSGRSENRLPVVWQTEPTEIDTHSTKLVDIREIGK